MPTIDLSLENILALLAASPPEPYVRTLARLAAEQPDFVAISCEDDRITRDELEARSNQLARAYAELGVVAGDFVTLALPNGIGFYVSYVAILKLGAVPQPISYRLPVAERQAIIKLAESALVVGAEWSDHPGRTCVAADFAPNADLSSDPLPELVSPAWKAPTSGGSTGRPKLIVAGVAAEGSPAVNAVVYQFGPDDIQVVAGPLYHNAPLSYSITGLLQGQRLIVMKQFDPETLLRLVADEHVTWLQLVPTMLLRMHRVLEAGGDYDLSTLRVLWHTASKCPEWLKQAWIDRIGAEKVYELYGGTESQAITVIRGDEWLTHLGSVGRPVLGEMAIFDENGSAAPANTPGEIFMRRPSGMPASYHYRGAEARERDGWESLGDLGWMDEEGYLYINDRRVDMIISGGANIYPAEVEAALDAHPHVVSSVVVGIPDEDLGARVHALVQTDDDTTVDELLAFLSQTLVRYKIPRSIELVDRPLRDDAGKARRSALRDEAIERLAVHP